jgi:hypothetical protein
MQALPVLNRSFFNCDIPARYIACSATHPDRSRQGCQRQARRAKSARTSLSLLRRPHAHHRDLLARATAEAPPLAKGQDRHLMMPTPVLDTHTATFTACVGSCPTAPPLASPRWIVAQSHPKHTKSRRLKRPLLDRVSTYVPPTRQNGPRCRFASSRPHLSSWPNPHSTRGTAACPHPAISCLGAFRTPATASIVPPSRHPKICTTSHIECPVGEG